MMRRFVPVTVTEATARGNLPPIDPVCCLPAWLLPGNRESIWPTAHGEKEGYFFIYYSPLSFLLQAARVLSCVFGAWARAHDTRHPVDKRGDDEIWDTWLDSKRRHSTSASTPRRPYNAALTGWPGAKGPRRVVENSPPLTHIKRGCSWCVYGWANINRT